MLFQIIICFEYNNVVNYMVAVIHIDQQIVFLQM